MKGGDAMSYWERLLDAESVHPKVRAKILKKKSNAEARIDIYKRILAKPERKPDGP